MKRKGFTLVELLVVIAIIALLMGILMPALNRVKQYAHRVFCGANLSGIGKAMLVYATDDEFDDYPVAGGYKTDTWSTGGYIDNWDEPKEEDAFDAQVATITSNLYMTIRYADVVPEQFICKGDNARAFKLSEWNTTAEEETDVWDFGLCPSRYCSYSYHMPYGDPARPITQRNNAGCPLAADRNPYLDENAVSYLDGPPGGIELAPSWDTTDNRYLDEDKTGNAAPHQREGQNVLFNDIHVNFEKYPNVGIDNDNIWKHWPSTDTPDAEGRELCEGGEPEAAVTTGAGVGEGEPQSYEDAYLVNEDQRKIGDSPPG